MAQKTVSLTKTKYNDFAKFINENLDSNISELVLEKFCEVFKYDPNATTYTKEKGKAHSQWRLRKAKELGITLAEVNKGIKSLTS